MTTRRDIQIDYICSLVFMDIREEVTLRRLGCTADLQVHAFSTGGSLAKF